MGYYVGIDVGGTFTDGVVADEAGKVYMFKTPTVSNNSALGFQNCLAKAADFFGLSLTSFLQKVEKLTYGTTLATNTLIEGKGASTGFITTKGFRDTLPIARIGREYLPFDLQVERPPSLISRRLIEEVSERVDCAGRVVSPLHQEDMESSLARLIKNGVKAIGVCLLWSLRNSAHEKRIGETIRSRYPEIYVTLSSELVPLIGEYERSATVAMNCLLGPPIKDQFDKLSNLLRKYELAVPLLIMQSTGGVIPAEDASLKPVALINSGPTGGVIASQFFAQLVGQSNLIGIDMGGTSFDVSLITEGQYSSSLVSRVHNQNIFVPMVDIHSIGAGGGSIARVDAGRLKVGPQSAKADPGPACYGKGGEEPTVTDADIVLGRINPDYFLGGEIRLDAAKARETIQKVAKPLGMSLEEAAWGICRIVDAQMADAIRTVTIEKGYDPRQYSLIAFGGAGPTHASALARELGIKNIVVPSLATVQSAFGIMASDILHTFTVSEITELEEPACLNEHFQRLEKQGLELLRQEGLGEEQCEVFRFADMRFKGQAHTVTMPVPGKLLDREDLFQLAREFGDRYESLYGIGTVFKQAKIEVVYLRVQAVGRTRKPVMRRRAAPEQVPLQLALKGQRKVLFDMKEGFLSTPTYDGEKLCFGHIMEGPSIVEYPGTTAVIYPQQQARVDAYLNLLISEKKI